MIESRHPALELLPRPIEKWESTRAAAPWRRAHIAAVNGYLDSRLPPGPAQAILALGDGIDTYIRECGVEWPSPYESEHLAPAIDAFSSMLDLELGGLDQGTLHAWACRMYDAIGWDYQTGTLR